jgi:hypothetical protein
VARGKVRKCGARAILGIHRILEIVEGRCRGPQNHWLEPLALSSPRPSFLRERGAPSFFPCAVGTNSGCRRTLPRSPHLGSIGVAIPRHGRLTSQRAHNFRVADDPPGGDGKRYAVREDRWR